MSRIKLKNDRKDVSVELYRAGKISLGRAAEISGLDYEMMKELLSVRGIPINRGPVSVSEAQREYSCFRDIV
jgi:predicted HTH domain antitoxin